MTEKFKVGDKVKIVKDTSGKNFNKHNFRLGRVGKVIAIAMNDKDCPFGVALRNHCGTSFVAQELKLIKGDK